MNGFLITLLLFLTAGFASAFYDEYSIGPRANALVRGVDLLEVSMCVASARDPLLCQGYTRCVSQFPPQVLMAYKKCRRAYNGSSWPQCFSSGPVFAPRVVGVQIVDCINANSPMENPAEEMTLVQMQRCFNDIFVRCLNQRRNHGLY